MRTHIVLCALACLHLLASANAARIDFDRLEEIGFDPLLFSGGFSEFDYLIDASPDDLHYFATFHPDYNTSPAMHARPALPGATPKMTLKRTDGSPFHLWSLEVDEIWLPPVVAGTPLQMTFTGYRGGVPVAEQSYITDVLDPDFERIAFTNFFGVEHVEWINAEANLHQVDNIVATLPAELSEALDQNTWFFEAGDTLDPANPGWFGFIDDPDQPEDTHDGVDAAIGRSLNGGTSYLRTGIPASGQLAFRWRRSSAAGQLSVTVGGQSQTLMTTSSWEPVSINVDCGATLEFIFSGEGFAYVDEIEFLPSPSPVTVSAAPSISVRAGDRLDLEINATGTDLLFDMYGAQDGLYYIYGATSRNLTIPFLRVTDGGQFFVVARDPCGGVASTTVQVTVLPPVVPSENLIFNGGFELPFSPLGAAYGDIPGWNAEPSVRVRPLPGLPSQTAAELALNNLYMEQTFETIPGAAYRLTFKYANSPFAPGTIGLVQLTGAGGSILNEDLLPRGTDHISVNLMSFEHDFVADSRQATLRFTCVDSFDFSGIFIDDVSVSAMTLAAKSKTIVLSEDTSVSFRLETDNPSGSALFFTVEEWPQHGELDLTALPLVTYSPRANFSGNDSFKFTASDGVLESQAAISLIVDPVNDSPVAVADSVSWILNRTLQFEARKLTFNDIDVDNNYPLSVMSVGATTIAGSALSLEGSGWIYYTPALDFVGQDTFTYRLEDAYGGIATGTVTINVAPGISLAPKAVVPQPDGSARVAFIGKAKTGYRVQHNDGDGWFTVVATRSEITGAFAITDPAPQAGRKYRAYPL